MTVVEYQGKLRIIETTTVRSTSLIGALMPVGGPLIGLGVGLAVGLGMSIPTGSGKNVGGRIADFGEGVWNGIKGFFGG
ncbi:hypothetical protein EII34_15250 [Arachnia propionica]|uniref:Uncharacterized protein n=1 Tax=Arachnia propionica TaxID=1750 RepID=A0A3P1T1Q4_9ACTN|nr:hypothetical protein [Arachnia propionica]RRD03168.1 hypothetical protein EII34_15250 [Arachnia propionica]